MVRIGYLLLLSTVAFGAVANAADPEQTLIIGQAQFEPARLEVPIGTKVKLTLRNNSNLPAEFESYDLSREIVVSAHGTATVYVGPLDAGTYKFFNDFNHDMKGVVVAGPPKGQGSR